MPRTAPGHCVRGREWRRTGCQGGQARPPSSAHRSQAQVGRSSGGTGEHGTDRMTGQRQDGQGSAKRWGPGVKPFFKRRNRAWVRALGHLSFAPEATRGWGEMGRQGAPLSQAPEQHQLLHLLEFLITYVGRQQSHVLKTKCESRWPSVTARDRRVCRQEVGSTPTGWQTGCGQRRRGYPPAHPHSTALCHSGFQLLLPQPRTATAGLSPP